MRWNSKLSSTLSIFTPPFEIKLSISRLSAITLLQWCSRRLLWGYQTGPVIQPGSPGICTFHGCWSSRLRYHWWINGSQATQQTELKSDATTKWKEHRRHLRSNTVLFSRASRRLRNNRSETTCTCKMRNVNCCWNVTSYGMRFRTERGGPHPNDKQQNLGLRFWGVGLFCWTLLEAPVFGPKKSLAFVNTNHLRMVVWFSSVPNRWHHLGWLKP